jgi:hypothetical protein
MRQVTMLVLAVLLGLVGSTAAQQPPPPQSLPEQLATCTSLLRVKQALVCSCESAEQLAGAFLRRAEKAEQQLEELKATPAPKPPSEPAPVPEKKE